MKQLFVTQIFFYRNQNLSHTDISERLNKDGIEISPQTVSRILSDAGFSKLKIKHNEPLYFLEVLEEITRVLKPIWEIIPKE